MNPRKLLLVGGVIVAMGWVLFASFITPDDISPEQSEIPSSPSATSEVQAGPDPEILVNEKRVKKRLARQFVAAYYGRDPLLFTGDAGDRIERFQTRLRPFVSDDFLLNQGVLLSVAQDTALVNAGGSIRARVAFFNGGHGTEIPVTVERTIRKPGDPPKTTLTPILLTLIEHDGEWAIDIVTEMV